MRERHEPIIELLPAYALGCLDAGEAESVAAHLATCAACRAELADYQAVVARLPLAARDCAPPPALKQQLMARVTAPAPTGPRAEPRLAAPPAWQIGAMLGRLTPYWAVASVVLVLALALGNFFLWQQQNQTQQQLNQLRAQNASLRTIALRGAEAAPTAVAMLVVDAEGSRGALVADELPPLDAQHQYQLWLIKDGQRTSGGVFSADADGYAIHPVSAPRPLREYSGFGVTVEPAGGSPGPTGARVLAGSL